MSSGASKEIGMLSDILEMIASDFSDVCYRLGVEVSTGDLLKQYFQQYEGPTAIEQVLINQGRLTKEEACRNTILDIINRRIDYINAHSEELKHE